LFCFGKNFSRERKKSRGKRLLKNLSWKNRKIREVWKGKTGKIRKHFSKFGTTKKSEQFLTLFGAKKGLLLWTLKNNCFHSSCCKALENALILGNCFPNKIEIEISPQ